MLVNECLPLIALQVKLYDTSNNCCCAVYVACDGNSAAAQGSLTQHAGHTSNLVLYFQVHKWNVRPSTVTCDVMVST